MITTNYGLPYLTLEYPGLSAYARLKWYVSQAWNIGFGGI